MVKSNVSSVRLGVAWVSPGFCSCRPAVKISPSEKPGKAGYSMYFQAPPSIVTSTRLRSSWPKWSSGVMLKTP